MLGTAGIAGGAGALLGALGQVLDAPRRMAWDAGTQVYNNLTGSHADSPESGVELLSRLGMDPESFWTKALGFGTEMALDPMTYLGGLGGAVGGSKLGRKALAELPGSVVAPTESKRRGILSLAADWERPSEATGILNKLQDIRMEAADDILAAHQLQPAQSGIWEEYLDQFQRQFPHDRISALNADGSRGVLPFADMREMAIREVENDAERAARRHFGRRETLRPQAALDQEAADIYDLGSSTVNASHAGSPQFYGFANDPGFRESVASGFGGRHGGQLDILRKGSTQELADRGIKEGYRVDPEFLARTLDSGRGNMLNNDLISSGLERGNSLASIMMNPASFSPDVRLGLGNINPRWLEYSPEELGRLLLSFYEPG